MKQIIILFKITIFKNETWMVQGTEFVHREYKCIPWMIPSLPTIPFLRNKHHGERKEERWYNKPKKKMSWRIFSETQCYYIYINNISKYSIIFSMSWHKKDLEALHKLQSSYLFRVGVGLEKS